MRVRLRHVKGGQKTGGVHVPAGSRDWILPLADIRASSLRRMGVCFSGIHKVRQGYDWGTQGQTHLLIGCLDGEGVLETAESSTGLCSGDLVLVPAGIARRYFTDAPFWRILTCRIWPLLQWQHLASGGLRSFSRPWLARLQLPVEGMLAEEGPGEGVASETIAAQGPCEYLETRYGAQIARLEVDPTAARPMADPFQLYSSILQAQLEAMLAPVGEAGDDPAIELASLWHRVREHPGRSWGTEDLAAELGVSRTTLHRQVKRWNHAPPGRIVEEIRMDEAKKLLEKSSQSIQVIADQVGYASGFSFSAAFKRFYGESPAAFGSQRA